LLGISVIVYGMPWPIEPQNKTHPIGNSFGEYQDYFKKPHYFHTGVDIRVNDPKGPNFFVPRTSDRVKSNYINVFNNV